MAVEPQAGLTYADFREFPDDNLRRELIDGELIVTAAPVTRHQRVVRELLVALTLYAREHGGEALDAPTDVYLSETNVVEPDVLFITAEHLDSPRIFSPVFASGWTMCCDRAQTTQKAGLGGMAGLLCAGWEDQSLS